MNEKVNLSFLRDKRVHYAWLLLVLGWACFRAFAINRFFGDHKINAWGYLLVDLAASIPYALYSAQAVVNFLDKNWHLFRKNVALTAAFFYLPDLYVVVFAREVPASLYIGFAAKVTLFSALAVLALGKDVSKVKK